MKVMIAAIGFCSALLVTSSGFAAEVPNWSLDIACADDSHPGACKEFEAIAKYQVSGPWQTIPDKVREICLTENLSFGQPSYRLLRMCLDAKLLEIHRTARNMRSAAPDRRPHN